MMVVVILLQGTFGAAPPKKKSRMHCCRLQHLGFDNHCEERAVRLHVLGFDNHCEEPGGPSQNTQRDADALTTAS